MESMRDVFRYEAEAKGKKLNEIKRDVREITDILNIIKYNLPSNEKSAIDRLQDFSNE